MAVQQIFNVSLGGLSFLFSFYTVGKLIFFVSNPVQYEYLEKRIQDNSLANISGSIFLNIGLLGLFILQHSLMALAEVKTLLANFHLTVASRSIYNICSSISLLILINYWQKTSLCLWSIEANEGLLWSFFIIIHSISWAIIYGGALLLDITELLGIKQIYYDLYVGSDPLSCKSADLQRLYMHMRHPSLTGFLVIFWIYPVMSLDRFVLAAILTLYMSIAWKTDIRDWQYQYNQLIRKQSKLH